MKDFCCQNSIRPNFEVLDQYRKTRFGNKNRLCCQGREKFWGDFFCQAQVSSRIISWNLFELFWGICVSITVSFSRGHWESYYFRRNHTLFHNNYFLLNNQIIFLSGIRWLQIQIAWQLLISYNKEFWRLWFFSIVTLWLCIGDFDRIAPIGSVAKPLWIFYLLGLFPFRSNRLFHSV